MKGPNETDDFGSNETTTGSGAVRPPIPGPKAESPALPAIHQDAMRAFSLVFGEEPELGKNSVYIEREAEQSPFQIFIEYNTKLQSLVVTLSVQVSPYPKNYNDQLLQELAEDDSSTEEDPSADRENSDAEIIEPWEIIERLKIVQQCMEELRDVGFSVGIYGNRDLPDEMYALNFEKEDITIDALHQVLQQIKTILPSEY